MKGVQHMKKYSLIIKILSLSCACMISAGCASQPAGSASAPPPPNSARLVVDRIANFGTFVNLVLSVDGKRVATLAEGQNYNGYLSPGQRTITAIVEPNLAQIAPVRKSLTVQAGQTYSYTAAWQGTNLVLNKNR
jgi:hypothetical protein